MNYLIVKEINWAAGDDYWGDYALISRASIPRINVIVRAMQQSILRLI